ncbi:hypothetical protein SERLA73DRAFT_140850 [Serpula lacrymans var. lacrymans S7.3]|uniref:Uncharacterized protein n=2 Tax=Serpula lacrymans var. lacrymans TaxID=341189 RepID=F8Q4C2_SERL3|nr:uncharacterized protein SERLADRAFT_396000 [Serpula lacrymans var. lacrymans S7.9]EGN96977.1 hypothetical protein SERLA73DRAFT_140850 [Serpula lacrymans var. lacrymans S7.3]EGO22571.1 hypothetical protein SERLADRAFT_396000 [Serpula lacrymans var. lacrymans S7.9]
MNNDSGYGVDGNQVAATYSRDNYQRRQQQHYNVPQHGSMSQHMFSRSNLSLSHLPPIPQQPQHGGNIGPYMSSLYYNP